MKDMIHIIWAVVLGGALGIAIAELWKRLL